MVAVTGSGSLQNQKRFGIPKEHDLRMSKAGAHLHLQGFQRVSTFTKIFISQPLQQKETRNKKHLRALAFGFYCKVLPWPINK